MVSVNTEIWGFLVLLRSRVLAWFPVFMDEPFFSSEWSCASPSMLRDNISGIGWKIIEFYIRMWAWSIFDISKSSGCLYRAKFGILVFADFSLMQDWIQLNILVGAWSWWIFIRKMPLDIVDSLRPNTIRRVVVDLLFIFILSLSDYYFPWAWILVELRDKIRLIGRLFSA